MTKRQKQKVIPSSDEDLTLNLEEDDTEIFEIDKAE